MTIRRALAAVAAAAATVMLAPAAVAAPSSGGMLPGSLGDVARAVADSSTQIPGAGDAGAVTGEQPWFAAQVPAIATQVVAVESTGGTTASLQRYERSGLGWTPVGEPVAATVGKNGLGGVAKEGDARTPAGVYTLNTAFGRAKDPGARVPYFQADNDDWWVGDSKSPMYNTHQECAPGTCPFDESSSEHLASYDVYDYALVMGVNPERRPYGGSAFFLHESNGSPTLGCVGVPTDVVRDLVTWADATTFIALR